MKKILMLLMFVFASAFAFAASQIVEPEPALSISQFFTSLVTISAIVPIVTQFILNRINTKFDQLISWLVAVLVCAFAWIFNLGMFVGLDWYWIIIYGLATGLVSNGIFDIKIVNAILSLIPKKREGGD